jgi:hypothetical protein
MFAVHGLFGGFPMTNIRFKATLEMLVPLVIKKIEKAVALPDGRPLNCCILLFYTVNWNRSRQSSGI